MSGKSKKKSRISKKTPATAKRRRVKRTHLGLSKLADNPIIAPLADNPWEAWQTFNAGAVSLNDQIHLLYRAIGPDGISRLGYAVSEDGFWVDDRSAVPIFEHWARRSAYVLFSYASGGSFGGAEDPRLVRVDNEDVLYMTYTACVDGLRVGLSSIKVKDFLKRHWKWKPPKLISKPHEVHKNWVIFPEKIKGRYAILTSLTPKILITYVDDLEFEDGKILESAHGGANKEETWEDWIRGAGPPPVKTKHGWLLLYHAMDKKDAGKYKVGALLLDLKDPTQILYRSSKPVLEPEESYEFEGFKGGVVYTTGAVQKGEDLLVYYGGADNYVCVASVNLEKFLEALMKGEKPAFKRRSVKKK